MKRSILTITFAFTTVLLTIVVVFLAVREPAHVGTWRRKAAALDSHCSFVRHRLAFDRRQVQDPRHRDGWFQFLRDATPFWKPHEIWTCLGYEMDLDLRTKCILDRDAECLTTLWNEVDAAMQEPRY